MADSVINIDDLANEIAKTLTNYSQNVQKGMNSAGKKVAKKAVKTLEATSPELTGSYAKGWRVAEENEFATSSNFTVHNKTDWSLTHLLEVEHALRSGGRSTPQVHIKPAEEQAIKEFEQEVKEAIENATTSTI